MICIFSLLSLQAVAAAPGEYCENPNLLKSFDHMKPTHRGDIDRLLVVKSKKIMYLLSNGVVVERYPVALGSAQGAKEVAGDLKTPEGVYYIDAHGEKSDYHQAMHVSYPDVEQIARAATRGVDPGSNIMLHGLPSKPIPPNLDHYRVASIHPYVNWTEGCIAVTDAQIDHIAWIVRDDTPIEICAGPRVTKSWWSTWNDIVKHQSF